MRIYSEIDKKFPLKLEIQDELNINFPITINQNYIETNCASGLQKVIHTSGFCIIFQNFTVLNNFANSLSIEKDYIQLSLLLKGKVQIIKPLTKTIKDIQSGFLQLAFKNKDNIDIKVFSQKKTINYTRIFISKSFILSIFKNEKWFSETILYRKIKSDNYINFGEIFLPVNFNIVNILSEIVKNSEIGVLGHSYYHIKFKELFLLILTELSTKYKVVNLIKKEDFDKINMAEAYLNTHYEEPPTIKQLSKIIHLNELKLKTGFKILNKCTIHDYITNVRMKHAHQMLYNKYPINEIALAVGYKSSSHFITSFKKFYGKTPKQYIMEQLP